MYRKLFTCVQDTEPSPVLYGKHACSVYHSCELYCNISGRFLNYDSFLVYSENIIIYNDKEAEGKYLTLDQLGTVLGKLSEQMPGNLIQSVFYIYSPLISQNGWTGYESSMKN